MDHPSNTISLSELMSHAENADAFFRASESAHRKIFGARHGPYSVDSMEYFSIALDCYKYARDNMAGKPRFYTREDILSYAVDQISLEGLVLEFGVASGQTINLIADKLPYRKIYGFDSFKGLPEAWSASQGAGHFAVEHLPAVKDNVELVVGLFDHTLPTFLDSHPGKVSFLHIDCDLYYSTQTVLTQLRNRIGPGTIIEFDEYFNYPGWHRHEFLAFQQFVEYERLKYEYIALVPCYEPVAVRIL